MMNRSRWLQVALVIALVGAAIYFRGRPSRDPATGSAVSPGDTIEALLDAAVSGDDEAYLRLLDGPLRERMSQSRDELGVESFGEKLRDSVRGLKGLTKQKGDSPGGDLVAIDVELAFADRYERQRLVLAEKSSGWVITSISPARRVEPPVQYGTPVFEEPIKTPTAP